MSRKLLILFSLLFLLACQPGENPGPSTPDPVEKPGEEQIEVPEPEKDYSGTVSVLRIDTGGRSIDSKEIWVENATITLTPEGEDVIDLGKTSIKRRGNSSMWYPKHSYNLKLDSKQKLLGMPSSKRWCLLANWMDRTLLRNDVAFEISRRTGLAWTPRSRFVELYMNGEYQGLYQLVEKIKIAKDRVDISDTGYIVELDTYYDEQYKFKSDILQIPVNFKEPDEDIMTDDLFNAFKLYFNQTEALIASGAKPDPAYKNKIDLDSFVDWLIVQELVQNGESWHPKSVYMHKDNKGLLCAGPTWDHDWGTFNSNVDWYSANFNIWYKYLMKDPDFKARLKERWMAQRAGFARIPDYIQQRADLIRPYALENEKLWPIDDQYTNGDEQLSFDEAIARMKDIVFRRYLWLDSQFANLK